MSEAGDYNPIHWKGHDFKSAYKVYDRHAGRGYSNPTTIINKVGGKSNLAPDKISTECARPLIILCDVTGSMSAWPKTMFSKLPYLEHECKEYLGEDTEFAFGAIGDAYSDNYPLQIRPFTDGTGMADAMQELIMEGGGGGQMRETYELGALYCVKNVEMPNAINPVIIFIGDEKPYDSIPADLAESVSKTDARKRVTANVFKQLQDRFSVYLIQKPYATTENQEEGSNKEIYDAWRQHLRADQIAYLPQPERVVDVIFGILAKEMGRVDYFKDEIEGRQTKAQVDTVYQSLASIHHPVATTPMGHSRVHNTSANTKKSEPLL